MHLVTGATGLLGSHIAEQLVERGERIRALVRPTSDSSFLEELGVELCRGDLNDPSALRRAFDGVRVVYHAAAKVGDWGSWAEHRRDSLEGTRHVLEACSAAGVGRLVYVSSVSAYGHPKPGAGPITEDHRLGTSFWWWDHYTRAKVYAERLVWDHIARTGLSVTLIRSGWLYGPRDRTTLHRIAKSLRLGRVRIVGDGTNGLNCTYAGNVAEACLLAAQTPGAAGRAYNVCTDGVITQREWMNLWADALGYPRPTKHLPYKVTFAAAFALEAVFRAIRFPKPPFITRYATWLVGRTTDYSTERARQELGWRPTVGYDEGVRRTVAWYRSQHRPAVLAG
jgi:nucleoside-diphosphate-sugar epimerase